MVLTCIGEILDGIRGNLDINRSVMCNCCFVLRGGVARKMARDLPKTRARQPKAKTSPRHTTILPKIGPRRPKMTTKWSKINQDPLKIGPRPYKTAQSNQDLSETAQNQPKAHARKPKTHSRWPKICPGLPNTRSRQS